MSIIITDKAKSNDKFCILTRGGVTKTRIIKIDHDTGEILGEYENKILVPGSQQTACKQFGLNPVVNLPTYNKELNLENPHNYKDYPEIQPLNDPITCLWCAGRDGAGSTPNEILTVSNTDRIDPIPTSNSLSHTYRDIVPFRYVDKDADLDADQRKMYFGRKELNDYDGNAKVAYFFKAFDTDPQLHVRYLDGTEVMSNMYTVVSSQQVEIYVEMRLSVTRKDFRDYFDKVLGWDNADISTISLCTAWYDRYPSDDQVAESGEDQFKYYYDILPYSKFNFGQEQLTDLNRAIDFIYQVYF